jgi:hypothetical protein
MVTNYPQQLAATSTTEARNDADSGFMSRMVIRMNQAVCGLHGHDSVLHFEGNRVMMRCTSCGYDSPGWEISGQGPRLRYQGDAERHQVSRPRMVA